ncbi:hypothetical protein EYF80_015490 [Liparis tanakae]|uniref:Uncharacterized protein n=1 Tax=Liparis tanakae TaxID=230148 RepID=A0A4Z2I8D0_9TELE|nr:hypothetical protein EYF80_015490 [Liparis tanakae]
MTTGPLVHFTLVVLRRTSGPHWDLNGVQISSDIPRLNMLGNMLGGRCERKIRGSGLSLKGLSIVLPSSQGTIDLLVASSAQSGQELTGSGESMDEDIQPK